MPYVPPKYPGEIPTAEDLPDRTDDIDWLYAARYNELKKELRAALIELGGLPKGSDANVTARLDRIQAELDAIPPPDPGEGHIEIIPPSYISIGQGTWVFTTSAANWFYGALTHTPANDGDNLSWKVYLAAGTYTLFIMNTTSNTMGIIDFDIDAVEVASFDLYTVGLVHNARRTETGIVIASSGLYTLKLRVDGKNASSGGYNVWQQLITLWRTA